MSGVVSAAVLGLVAIANLGLPSMIPISVCIRFGYFGRDALRGQHTQCGVHVVDCEP
jgi:hypothetical protein